MANSSHFLLHLKFEKISKDFPEKIAIFTDDKRTKGNWTYRSLYETSRAISYFLFTERIKRADRIAVILENRPEWPIIYFGIMAQGATCVPIDTQSTSQEIINILKDSSPKLLFTSSRLLPRFKKEAQTLQSIKNVVVLDLEVENKGCIPFSKAVSIGFESKDAFVSSDVDPDDVASLIYTSGTTGRPKGVVLTHKNFSSNLNGIYKTGIITADDNILSILPLHHTYSFTVTLLAPLLRGGSITYVASLKTEDIFKAMRDFHVTIFIGVPQIFNMIDKSIKDAIKRLSFLKRLAVQFLRETLWLIRKSTGLNLGKKVFSRIHSNFGASLKFFASGGAKLDKDVALGLSKFGFTILEGYGLTETSPVVTFSPREKPKIGSVGKALPGVSVKILNPDPSGIGEILIKGENVMKGYYNMPDETKDVIRDNWFYSGDLGYLDKDGYLYITGRIKDVIVLSTGKNVYPDEVESYYSKSRFIKEICVFTIPKGMREESEDLLYASIVPNMEIFKKEGRINVEGSIRWDVENLSKALPPHMRIMGFSISNDPLPRTRLGKIKRYEVRRQFLEREKFLEEIPLRQEVKEEDIELFKSALAQNILSYLKKECGMRRDVNLYDHLELDLGVDSLKRIEILSGIEALFKVRLTDAFMADVYTVKELVLKLLPFVKETEDFKKTTETKEALWLWSDILKKAPREDIIKKIELKPKGFANLLIFTLQKILFFKFKIFFLLKVDGKENIPKDGPYILCVNHTSYIDGFVVASSVRYRDEKILFFLGYRAYFEHPLVAWAIKLARLIPIDPASQLVDAMQAASFVLKNDKALCIFPEGERSPDGKVMEFKKGIGILAKELKCPLIPVYIKGAFKAWPRTKALPRPYPIKIKFGHPLSVDELKELGSPFGGKDDYEVVAMGIRKAILDLE